MAYPDAILTVGALSNINDIFEYFKGALVDSASTNPEMWPYHTPSGIANDYFITSYYMPPIGSAISAPMTRQAFYDWIDYWTITTSSSTAWVNATWNMFRTIHGTRLYQFTEPLGTINWPVAAVNDWAKIKTLELGLFGSVGNGGDLTATSIVGSGVMTSRVPTMTHCALTYLRYALIRFSTYGGCHPAEVLEDPLTDMTQNTTTRRIDFTLPAGRLLGDTERSFDFGETWSPITEKPMIVPAGTFEVGQIQLRVRMNRGAYIEASESLENTVVFP